MGQSVYPQATELLILADSGGSSFSSLANAAFVGSLFSIRIQPIMQLPFQIVQNFLILLKLNSEFLPSQGCGM